MEMLDNALKQGITPAIVVAVYLIINKIIDTAKDKKETKLSSDLVKSINVIGEFLADITKNIIDKDKEKCKAAIEDCMIAFGMKLVSFVSTTIINNHIEINRDTILSNINDTINSEYYKAFSTLSLYKINGVVPADHMNKEWMKIMEQDMIDIIYNNSLNKEDKILSFSVKINIKFQTYITYITNNTVK